jgi:hypothetical protein
MTVVSLRQDPAWMAHRWAQKNCHSYISMDPIIKHDGYTQLLKRIDYQFGENEDAAWFLLKWS